MNGSRRTFFAPNLARRPFVNRRPVARVSLLLAVIGLLLLVLNLFLYVGYARTRAATATELRDIETRIEAEEEALEAAASALAEAELDEQNELVSFLNGRIAERTFGWSVLFDRLADLLPDDVRLVSLAPRVTRPDETRRRSAGAPPPERRAELGIQAEAKDGEDILELIDALFADPAFRNPNLSSEAMTQGNRIRFSLSVVYLPDAAEAMARDGAADGAENAGADGDGEDGGRGAAPQEEPS